MLLIAVVSKDEMFVIIRRYNGEIPTGQKYLIFLAPEGSGYCLFNWFIEIGLDKPAEKFMDSNRQIIKLMERRYANLPAVC